MANLDPRIEAVRAKFDLSKDDFWQIPQNKQWVCKHAALEIVATKANVEWYPPQIVQADTTNSIAVIVATGKMGERVEWATGEASPKNNKNSYPWAMAEKRAKDRVVLKLVGIHGLVYSEDEADDFKPGKAETAREPAPKPQEPMAPPEYKMLMDDLRKNRTQADIRRWIGDADVKDLRRMLSPALDEKLRNEAAAYGKTLPSGDQPVNDDEARHHPLNAA